MPSMATRSAKRFRATRLAIWLLTLTIKKADISEFVSSSIAYPRNHVGAQHFLDNQSIGKANFCPEAALAVTLLTAICG